MSETKVYIKKFHGKHFDIQYYNTTKIIIYFPVMERNDRLMFTIVFSTVPTKQQLQKFIKNHYDDLKIIYNSLTKEIKNSSVEDVIERISHE